MGDITEQQRRNEQLDAAWARADAQRAFWQAHFRPLQALYSDQFVATPDAGQSLYHAPTLEGIVSLLARHGYDVHRAQVWLTFIAAADRVYVF